MKHVTKKIIKKRFDKLNRYLEKQDEWFHARTIHSFRLEVKKLRSFLALLSVDHSKISAPRRLKKLYGILGKIRLNQLQRNAITGTTEKYNILLPAQYLAGLEKEKRELKKEAENLIHKTKSLSAKKLIRVIPARANAGMLRKYFARQGSRLHGLLQLRLDDNESLHQVRKILKSLLYALSFLKQQDEIKKYFSNDQIKDLKLLESKIGEFHDISISRQILKEALKDVPNLREKESLIWIKNRWQKDLDESRKQIDLSGVGH